jgi:hypothetical protein
LDVVNKPLSILSHAIRRSRFQRLVENEGEFPRVAHGIVDEVVSGHRPSFVGTGRLSNPAGDLSVIERSLKSTGMNPPPISQMASSLSGCSAGSNSEDRLSHLPGEFRVAMF